MPHILIAEDDPSVRSTIRSALIGNGHRVTEAANGREAVKAFHAGGVDLMVLDMLMPEMDGVETLRALRSFAPSLPVVAMSGGVMANSCIYLHCARLMGAAQVLQKPFNAEKLLQAVASALAGSTGETQG